MKKFFQKLFGTKAEKTLHFTDSAEYFNGVEFDAYTRGELSI